MTATAIKEFSATESGLAQLRKDYEKVSFPVETKEGFEDAKKALREVVTYRTSLEKMRKKIKAPVLEKAKLIDSEAARITAELLAIEKPIADQVNAEKNRLEKIAEEKRLAEEKRVTAIRDRITAMQETTKAITTARDPSVDNCSDAFAAVSETIIDGSFEEFQSEANHVKLDCLEQLAIERKNAIHREKEAEKIAADRAELEKLRKKQEADAAELERLRAAAAPPEPEPEPEFPTIANGDTLRVETESNSEGTRVLSVEKNPGPPDYPGAQAIIDCVAVKFDVSLGLARVWIDTCANTGKSR